MTFTTIHNPDLYMADLRQILSQGRKRIGVLIGAGAPTSIRVNSDNEIEGTGSPLIPDVSGLTEAVVSSLAKKHQDVIEKLKNEIKDDTVNIEHILTRVRRLAEAIGNSSVHDLNGSAYNGLALQICKEIGEQVQAPLPDCPNPYSQLVSWIAGTQRNHSVEIFTPNYDLLIEEAFERAQVPYFDGFTGAHRPFFDSASVSSSYELPIPARWTLLWKLHGSLGWSVSNGIVVRTGDRNATELIYPEHLKYDQVSKLPYSALFERLRRFLMTPDTLLICTGFSFRDYHIKAVLDEALATNTNTAVFAFQYGNVDEEDAATQLASTRTNMSVYAKDGAIINGTKGSWRPSESPNEDWRNIRQTFWSEASSQVPGEFLLGDFAKLAYFLALTQAQKISSDDESNQDEDDGA